MRKYLAALAALAVISAPAWAADSHHPVRDSYITAKVKAELVKDPNTDADAIHVTTRNGVVTLRGVVKSSAAIDEAKMDALKIDGVRKVRNELQAKQYCPSTPPGPAAVLAAEPAVPDHRGVRACPGAERSLP